MKTIVLLLSLTVFNQSWARCDHSTTISSKKLIRINATSNRGYLFKCEDVSNSDKHWVNISLTGRFPHQQNIQVLNYFEDYRTCEDFKHILTQDKDLFLFGVYYIQVNHYTDYDLSCRTSVIEKIQLQDTASRIKLMGAKAVKNASRNDNKIFLVSGESTAGESQAKLNAVEKAYDRCYPRTAIRKSKWRTGNGCYGLCARATAYFSCH